MLDKISSSRYYLFSISNLLAAFGGGLILGKATDVITHPLFHGGSILAFFIGSVLGLSFLLYGLMGACSAIGFWLLISFKVNLIFAITLLVSCITTTIFAIFRRIYPQSVLSNATV